MSNIDTTTFDSKSLARWRADPATFIEKHLIDPETSRPFQLLPAQHEFLRHALTLNASGRLVYPDMVFGAVKKSGKTGFAALFVLVVLLLHGGRFAEGYCVANDLEQAQSRVFEMIRRIVEASPLLAGDTKITGNKITFPATGATVQALASDFASAAGGHPIISVFDELWGYASERARRLYDELVPVPTRRISCRLIVSHAGFEGEGQLLQEIYNRGLTLPQVGPSLYAGDGLLMAWHHEPIAPWQDEKWLAQMRRTLRPNQYLRMIENKFVTTEESFVDMAWWDACVDPTVTPIVVNRDLPIWVAVDASTKRDSTAIVAVTFDRQAQKVILVNHRIFLPSVLVPLDFEGTIERTLRELSHHFSVRGVFYDPYQMIAVAQRLQAAGLPMREFPQTVANLTAIGSNLYELIKARSIVAYPDANIRVAISRAVAVETSRGWRIAKDKVSHKIDVVVALAMACHAAIERSAGHDEVKIVVPWYGSRGAHSVPGSPPIASVPASSDPQVPASSYNYDTQSDWKAYVNADGSIRSKPRGPWDF
jgi:phage terminase large subunit-like protein